MSPLFVGLVYRVGGRIGFVSRTAVDCHYEQYIWPYILALSCIQLKIVVTKKIQHSSTVVVHRTAGRLSALSARRPPYRLGSGRRQMVSITFDEFHAIRSRQRAAAEVVDSSKIKNNTAGDATSSANPASHTDADERGGGSSVTGRRRTASSKFSSHGGSDEGEEVAPTSGSVSKVRWFLASSYIYIFFCLLVCVDTLRGSCSCTMIPPYVQSTILLYNSSS